MEVSMMKRIGLLALALALLISSALAESGGPYAFGGFELTVPENVTVEEYDSSRTVVRDQTRVVVKVIPQELAEDGEEQVQELLTIYNEHTAEITAIPLMSGLYGAMGLIEDCFGEGIHEVPVLILSDGELLILAGYNHDGDTLAVHELITELLSGVTLAGEPILPTAATKEK